MRAAFIIRNGRDHGEKMVHNAACCGLAADGRRRRTPQTWEIGICQLEQHAALDEATQGFIDAVEQQLGQQVRINVRHASC